VAEFDFIRDFVRPFGVPPAPVGPGDDCAVVPSSRTPLCVTTDAVVEGVHFTLRHFSWEDVGHKALAVNLSDLAAMGAVPSWFVCALALPRGARSAQVRALARGMAPLAREAGIRLVGGNFTQAKELSVTLTAAGRVGARGALLRSGGRPGDQLYVSGTLGDARLGLACLGMRRAPRAQLRQRRPRPRLGLGLLSAHYASAGIDISDGLVGDLGHLCNASRVGARVSLAALPVSSELRKEAGRHAWRWAVAGGEDYELLLAVPRKAVRAFERASRRAGHSVANVGELTRRRAVVFVDARGRPTAVPHGFEHFTP